MVVQRMKRSLVLYDTVRIDHFRGFAEYYAIPADAENALEGEWKEGPGIDLFRAMEKALGDMDVIAEDLGTLDEKVFELMDETDIRGESPQFAFLIPGNTNFYLRHRYKKNCVVYTGTHDNDTTKAWYYGMNDWAREYSKAYLNNYDRPWEASAGIYPAAEAALRSGSDSDVGSVVLWQRRKNESSIHTGGKLEMEDASGRVP